MYTQSSGDWKSTQVHVTATTGNEVNFEPNLFLFFFGVSEFWEREECQHDGGSGSGSGTVGGMRA